MSLGLQSFRWLGEEFRSGEGLSGRDCSRCLCGDDGCHASGEAGCDLDSGDCGRERASGDAGVDLAELAGL